MPEIDAPTSQTCPITGLIVGSTAYFEHTIRTAIRSLDPDCDAFIPLVGLLAQKIARHRQGKRNGNAGIKL